MFKFVPLALAATVAFSAACANAQELLKNGGFEEEAAGVPPGFAIWGTEQSNNSENFKRDSSEAHSGKASLRIHHLANAPGYIVSSPFDNAIKAEKSTEYTASFWAKTDKPGYGEFRIGSYLSTKRPLSDGQEIGDYQLKLETEWRKFTFTFIEGRDFIAENSPFIYLCISAAKTPAEERTVWIDEISVTSKRNADSFNLVDGNKIPFDAPRFPLKPGAELSIAIDPSKVLRKANKLVGGISFHRVAGWAGRPYSTEGKYTVSPETEQAIKDLKLPLTRFYALGDERFSLEESIDKVAALLDRLGIPQETVVLEFENQGSKTKLSPEDWARGVKYSVGKGYKFRYWEISNEPYYGSIFKEPSEYVEHYKKVNAAIKAAQPDAKTVLETEKDDFKWGNYLLGALAGQYDLVAPHWYGWTKGYSLEDTILGDNYETTCRIARLNALIKHYNKDRDVAQYDTEWGLLMPTPDGKEGEENRRNANIVGVLYRATRLVSYTGDGILRGATAWEMFIRKPNYGFCTFDAAAEDKRSCLYWFYYYYNRSVCDNVLAIEGTAPYYAIKQGRALSQGKSVPATPALVTSTNDGKRICAMLVNGVWENDCPTKITVDNFQLKKASGVILSCDDKDALPLLERKEDFVKPFVPAVSGNSLSFTLPGHSVVFLTLEQ